MSRLAIGTSLAAAILLTFACSGGDDGNGDDNIVIPRDAGLPRDAGPARDAGPRDAGPPDCSTNPNRCAPMQVMDAACACLPECEGNLEWNMVLLMCEEPPAGECEVSNDCEQDEVCLNVNMQGQIEACNGEVSCRCLLSCNPWARVAQTGCPPTLDLGGGDEPVVCTWLGASMDLPDALCLPEGQGGGYGEACTVMRDVNNNRVGDTCNRQQNFYCLEDARMGATGVCSRFCKADEPEDICAEFGMQPCVQRGFLNLDPQIGWCQNEPAPGLAMTCTSSVTCAGGICSSVLQNSCSQGCGGFDQCAVGDFCIGFNGVPMGEEQMCIKGCVSPDATGDAECSALNMALICRDVFNTGGQVNLCLPPCTLIGCADPNTMCDPASGRCM